MVAVAVLAFLAFGVFGVQALWIDDEVAEAAPTFDSGAALPPATTAPPDDGETGATTTAPAGPTVTVAATGTFVADGHPGEGTVNVLTDGTQAFVRFEDDFATDNGPDLRARAFAGDEVIDLGPLKGNIGAQNYELPAGVDPAALTAVDVWCRRFDYVFTTAELTR